MSRSLQKGSRGMYLVGSELNSAEYWISNGLSKPGKGDTEDES